MRVAEIRELQGKDTFAVKNSGLYPVVGVESGDVPAVGLAGARLLTRRAGSRAWATSFHGSCLRGGGRGRCTTRARSSWIWRCAWPWEAGACRMWPCCDARGRPYHACSRNRQRQDRRHPGQRAIPPTQGRLRAIRARRGTGTHQAYSTSILTPRPQSHRQDLRFHQDAHLKHTKRHAQPNLHCIQS